MTSAGPPSANPLRAVAPLNRMVVSPLTMLMYFSSSVGAFTSPPWAVGLRLSSVFSRSPKVFYGITMFVVEWSCRT